MIGNPYGGALPQNPQNIMAMIASLFKNMGGGQGPNGFMRPTPQNNPQQPQPQQPNMTSGIGQALDPNKGFMAGLMGKPNPGGAPTTPQIGAPIANTPSTNMQNNPFMQMPQINGGVR